MEVVLDNRDVFLEGLRTTLALTALGYLLALVLGAVGVAFRIGPVPPLRWLGTLYVEMWRNTPLTVAMVLFFFGLTKIGIRYSSFVTAVIVLGAYTGAFVAETLRAGVLAVPRGQAEAARSIGLTFPQMLGSVVLPQATRTVIAPLGSLFIALVKNSSIASIISSEELLFVTERLNDETARPVAVFLGAAFAYLLVTIPAGLAFGALERRVAIRR